MNPVTTEEERQILDHCQQVGVQIRRTVPEDIKTADPGKLRLRLASFRFDDEDRIHPYYARGKTGRIMSRPQLETLPWEMLEAPEGYTLLDTFVWSTEPLFVAKAVGQGDLYRELVHERKSIGDALRDKLGLDKHERQIAKLAFFWHTFGMTKSHPEAVEIKAMAKRILDAYPKLRRITSDRRRDIINTAALNTSALGLGIARAAHEHPYCRLVGFWHMEPLIECSESEADRVSTELINLGDMALRVAA